LFGDFRIKKFFIAALDIPAGGGRLFHGRAFVERFNELSRDLAAGIGPDAGHLAGNKSLRRPEFHVPVQFVVQGHVDR